MSNINRFDRCDGLDRFDASVDLYHRVQLATLIMAVLLFSAVHGMGNLVWVTLATMTACTVALLASHANTKEGMTPDERRVAAQTLLAMWALVSAIQKHGKKCALTYYSSYPRSAAEGYGYNGYAWSGLFKGVNSKKPEKWVKNHNIAAVHSEDWGEYGNKWILVSWKNKFIYAKVVDVCADADTPNKKQCTLNKTKFGKPGFLVDLEYHTARRIGFQGMEPAWCALVKEPPANHRYLYGTDTNFK